MIKPANHIAIDETFVEDTLSEFPDYLQSKENFIKLAAWYANQWKRLDDEVVKLGYFRLLDNAQGVVLDNIGAFLGIPRGNQNDASYRGRIKFRSLRQSTDGTRPDVIKLLIIIFAGEVPRIYKGDRGYIQLTVPSNCLDNEDLVQELEELFPIDTNLWVVQDTTGYTFGLVSLKNPIQPPNVGGLGGLKTPNSGGNLTDLIHTSGKIVKFK